MNNIVVTKKLIGYKKIEKDSVEYMSPLFFFNQFLEYYKDKYIIIEGTLDSLLDYIDKNRINDDDYMGSEFVKLGFEKWIEELNEISYKIEFI